MSSPTSRFIYLLFTLVCLQLYPLLINTGLPGVYALKTNITFDDAALGDATTKINFLPANQWSLGQTCSGCHAKPDKALAGGGTWHDTTYDTSRQKTQPSVVFNFVGTAIYVYCIMANTLPSTGTHSSFSFMMDGNASPQTFNHVPDRTSNYEYNVLVFSQDGLSNGPHTFTLLPNPGSGVDGSSLVLFDYVQYTVDIADPAAAQTGGVQPAAAATAGSATNPTTVNKQVNGPSASPSSGGSTSSNSNAQGNAASSSSTKKSNAGAIAGGVIGALVALAIIAAIGFLCIRGQFRKEQTDNLEKVEPYQFAMYGSQTQHSGGGGGNGQLAAAGYANVSAYSPPPTAMPYTPSSALQPNRYGVIPPAVSPPPVNENLERWRQNIVPPSEAHGTSVYNNLGHSRQGSHGLESIADDVYSGVDTFSNPSSPTRSGTLSTATRMALQSRVDELEQRLARLTSNYPPQPPQPQPQRQSELISDLPYASPPSPPARGAGVPQEVLQQNVLMQLQIQQLQEEIQLLRVQQGASPPSTVLAPPLPVYPNGAGYSRPLPNTGDQSLPMYAPRT